MTAQLCAKRIFRPRLTLSLHRFTIHFSSGSLPGADRDLLVERNGPCVVLTLNRPEKRNALSSSLVDKLLETVEGASADGTTRLMVIKGKGKAMCSGFDFSGLEEHSDSDLAVRFIRLELLLQAIHHAPFSTLALVHGGCYGAGADLVAACGQRVACPESSAFRLPGLNFGIVLGTRRLASSVGKDSSRRILEMSKVFKAPEATECGFVTDLVRPLEWDQVVEEATTAATSLPVGAQRAMLLQTCGLDTRDSDLAVLVRSATVPGLKNRIQDFVQKKRRH